jgi:hypothetical protein
MEKLAIAMAIMFFVPVCVVIFYAITGGKSNG